jgi:hypothetical protein
MGRALFLFLVMLIRAGLGQEAEAGAVDFRNGAPFVTSADRKIYQGPGVPLVGTNFVAALYFVYGPDRDSVILDGFWCRRLTRPTRGRFS